MSFAISKSKYCNAVQCPKMLWMHKNMPEKFDESVMNESVLENGSAVGDLAMGLFGEFIEVPFDLGLSGMVERTTELMEAGTPLIAEASFAKDGMFCSVDILKNLGNQDVELYEVKSSTHVSDIYKSDVAYQCYVLTQCGYHVKKACLVHIDNTYIRHGELELNKFFCVVDLTKEAFAMFPEVQERIEMLRTYMQQQQEPECAIGMQCQEPYDCGFFAHCAGELPHPNVFDISRLSKKKMFEYYHKNMVSFADLNGRVKLSPSQQLQVDHSLQHCPPHIDKPQIKAFLNTLSYPLYFLDFESFQPAVPLYDNSKPYQQIAFQYSLHYMQVDGGELLHKEYLAYPDGDPRRGLAEQLCLDIPKDVCVLAYNMGFEKGRIAEMAALYPDLRDHLMNIHDHIVDLMIPFQQKAYYCEAMQGSYSIKYVLPALFPNDPELDYHNLEEVQNGGDAMALFPRMADMDAETLEKSRKNLLKYCGLDTYAMVKVLEKLKEAAR